jgi:hypothetical protein
LELRNEAADGVALCRIAGKIDALTGPSLQAAAASAIDAGNPRIIFDMREVAYISSGKVLARLVEAGILRVEDQKFLWVFSRRAYPQSSGREEREAKARLMSVIFDDKLPTPRDTLLVSLADSTGILDQMLSSKELSKVSKRIAEVVALEETSRSVRAVVASRRVALAAGASARSWVGPGKDW